MNYIGSKYKLLPFLSETIEAVAGADMSDMVFCDIFAGTGIVGRHFKKRVKRVISNDWEYYGYVLNRNYIGNHHLIDGADAYIEELNSSEPVDYGFIYKNYCEGGGSGRQYFSDSNGRKIDAVRRRIEQWKAEGIIDEDTYFFLLCSLLESADKYANTASVYGAFLKQLKKSAQREMILEPANFDLCDCEHEIHCTDANELIHRIEGDILYLDPPYNARQFGANYHMLNTIAEYKPFSPQGKTGLRDYARSVYCSARTVKAAFEELIREAKFRYIFLSYNNEGLMSSDDIRTVMSRYGRYDLVQTDYQRFKADKTDNRNHKASSTTEYLHILEKS